MHRIGAPSLMRIFSVLSIAFIIYPFSVFVAASPILDHTNARSNSIEARATVADIPSVDDIRAEIRSHGRVGHDVSLFYTSLSGGRAVPAITSWYQCNLEPIFRVRGVAWDGIIDGNYLDTVGMRLMSPTLIDKFLKRVSQAFAAESAGQVVVFYPDGKGDPTAACATSGHGLNPPGGYSAWCGQEYPTLTRNPKVKVIYQVDPASDTKHGNIIWQSSDGPKLQVRQEQIN
ncbi:hypothetical protein F5Y13DRAFT_189289 [Hypoxylon sp. FL1857]|nr:hypothetical protein F5Y13DRAFT_189289 [Hypoxylon sp. FL1857]